MSPGLPPSCDAPPNDGHFPVDMCSLPATPRWSALAVKQVYYNCHKYPLVDLILPYELNNFFPTHLKLRSSVLGRNV